MTTMFKISASVGIVSGALYIFARAVNETDDPSPMEVLSFAGCGVSGVLAVLSVLWGW